MKNVETSISTDNSDVVETETAPEFNFKIYKSMIIHDFKRRVL